MEFEVGKVYQGKVTGITKFGAFVLLPGGKSGMVHISEVANTYVDEISKFLKEGQEVSVKLIAIDQQNRINLSIKKALPPQPPSPPRQPSQPPQPPQPFTPRAASQSTLQKTEDDSFEGKLKAFMQTSESRMSDIRSQKDKRSGGKRRK